MLHCIIIIIIICPAYMLEITTETQLTMLRMNFGLHIVTFTTLLLNIE